MSFSTPNLMQKEAERQESKETGDSETTASKKTIANKHMTFGEILELLKAMV